MASKPRVKYDVGDLPYHILGGFLLENWDHEHLSLNVTDARRAFYAQHAHCEDLGNDCHCFLMWNVFYWIKERLRLFVYILLAFLGMQTPYDPLEFV